MSIYRHAFLAVPGRPKRLLDRFLDSSPRRELSGTAMRFADHADALRWCVERSRCFGARTPEEARAVHADGPWAVLLDYAQELFDEEELLTELSHGFGYLAAGRVDTERSHYELRTYDRGYLQRELLDLGMRTVSRGAPLPGEAQLGPGPLGLRGLERLWMSLGLSSFLATPIGPVLTLCTRPRVPQMGRESGRR